MRPIAEVLKRQRDVVTWSQALAAGVNKDTISRRIRPNGPWQRLLPGVYLTVSGTPTLDQRDIAALLYAGAGSALTGKAALRWHGLRAGSGQTIDVLVAAPKQRQSAGFVSIHPTMRLPPQVCCRGPVSYVLPARAVADAAVWLRGRDDVRALVAGAVQRRLCTVQQLTVELRDGPVRGSALLRAVIAEVADGIRSSREAELKDLISRGQLPTPMFNARLYVGEELIAVADAWWRDAGVAVETDSKEWHLSPADWEATMRRHARMTALGILVLHFSPRQIRYEPEMVLKTIRQALDSRSGHPALAIRTLPAIG